MNVPITITIARPRLWRVKHDIEIERVWRAGLPEVHPVYPNHHVPFDRWQQVLSKSMNPQLSADGWTDMYHYRYWIANNQGFGMNLDPRANFVLPKNETSDLPRVEALVCGGSLVEELDSDNDWVYLKAIDFRTPVSLQWLKNRPQFWVRGIFSGGDGTPRRMLGNQFQGPPITHPFFADTTKPLRIEKFKLQLWTDPNPPDPLRIYIHG